MSTENNVEELVKKATDLRNNGQEEEAIESYKKAAELYEEEGNKKQVAECWHMIGVSYNIEGNVDKAIENLKKAADLHKESGNKIGLGRAYRDIGTAYVSREKYEEAYGWIEKSVEVLGGKYAYIELGISQAKLGVMKFKMGDMEAAEKLLNEGMGTIRKDGYPFYEATVLVHLAEVNFARKNFGEMVSNLWGAVGLIYLNGEQDKQKRKLAQIYGLLAHGYLELENVKDGKKFYEKAVDLMKDMPNNVAESVKKEIKAEEFVDKLNI